MPLAHKNNLYMGTMFWIYAFQVCHFLKVGLEGGAYFKRDSVESENIWHNAQVTFLNIVLLCFCMAGGTHTQLLPPGKGCGEGSGVPDREARTAPHFDETRGSSRGFPSGSLRTHPVLSFPNCSFRCSFLLSNGDYFDCLVLISKVCLYFISRDNFTIFWLLPSNFIGQMWPLSHTLKKSQWGLEALRTSSCVKGRAAT